MVCTHMHAHTHTQAALLAAQSDVQAAAAEIKRLEGHIASLRDRMCAAELEKAAAANLRVIAAADHSKETAELESLLVDKSRECMLLRTMNGEQERRAVERAAAAAHAAAKKEKEGRATRKAQEKAAAVRYGVVSASASASASACACACASASASACACTSHGCVLRLSTHVSATTACRTHVRGCLIASFGCGAD